MKKTKIWLKIIGWIVSIIVAIIGTFSVSSMINEQKQEQTQEQHQSQSEQQNQSQEIIVNIDGQNVELKQDNAQKIYDDLEQRITDADNQLSSLETQIAALRQQNSDLLDENKKFESYGTDALVSTNKNFDADKTSLFAFSPVNSSGWDPNEGTLKDSLDNGYSVSLPYIIISNGSYGEYYTNGKYTSLELKIAAHESMSTGTVSQIKVYADDLLVFSSMNIDRKTEMQMCSVSINNAKFIKITCERVGGYDNSSTLILDATLIK